MYNDWHTEPRKGSLLNFLLGQKLDSSEWMQGYVLGNPATDPGFDDNAPVPFAYGMGLISDELYEVTQCFAYADDPIRFCLITAPMGQRILLSIETNKICPLQSLKRTCRGQYQISEPSNAECVNDLLDFYQVSRAYDT